MRDISVTQTHRLAFIRNHNARRAVRKAPQEPRPDPPTGRVPRIAKLMALAIRFEHLLASGAVRDQTELAELGHVTRARITQIMNLLHLAPDIQEELLYLPRVIAGKEPIPERRIRPIVAEPHWERQRRLWRQCRTRDLEERPTNASAARAACR